MMNDKLAGDIDLTSETTQNYEIFVQSLMGALDAVSHAVFVHDAHGDLVFANVLGKELSTARHEEAGLMRAVNEAIGLALQFDFSEQTFSIYGPPKRDFTIRTSAASPNLAHGVVAVIEDLTVRNQLDTIRRDFVANVSHELRTPIGALGLLAETLAFEDEPTVRQRLANRIQNEAFRVAKIIDDLLDLSKIESNPMLVQVPVSLTALAQEVVDQLAPVAELAKVKIELIFNTDHNTVYGDLQQLRSALANLLDNSIKYSESNSTVQFQFDANENNIVISVIDHGIGIPQKDLERIFERFYRVDQARSRQTGGTGLGLSIVRHAVNNHNGSIEVESREGAGSTFRILLPRKGSNIR